MSTPVEVHFPPGQSASASDTVAQLTDARPLGYFDEVALGYLAAVSRRLMRDPESRAFPELVSLGYFLRRTALEELRRKHARSETAFRQYPIGVVFHVPPANVDTMFVYSWAISLLCGNTNVVRLSNRAGRAALVIVRLLGEALRDGQFDRIAETQRIVSYGHVDEVTAEFCRACDLRIIWGGDESVRALRRYEMKPSARDLAFPDRNSFAVIAADAFSRLPSAERRRVAERLYNDIFWFDQAGCSSPRWLLWVADESVTLESIRRALFEELQSVIATKNFRVETGMAIEKLVGIYGEMMLGHVGKLETFSNEFSTVWAEDLSELPRRYLGAGVIVEARVSSLLEVAPLVRRADQTIAHFGFSVDELAGLAELVNGRGVDRMVPLGQALTFSAVWDGLDLVGQMTRLVELEGSEIQPSL